jgi:hypothetical protein
LKPNTKIFLLFLQKALDIPASLVYCIQTMIKYTVTVDDEGTKRWIVDGKLHRTDGPAIEYADGEKHWFQNGKPIESMDLRLNSPMETSVGTKTTSFIEQMDLRLNA